LGKLAVKLKLERVTIPFENCVFRNGIHTEYFAYLQCKSGIMNIITEYAIFERKRNPLYKVNCSFLVTRTERLHSWYCAKLIN